MEIFSKRQKIFACFEEKPKYVEIGKTNQKVCDNVCQLQRLNLLL